MQRLGAGREQQRPELDLPAAFQMHTLLPHVDRCDVGVQQQFDLAFGIVFGRSQRNPVFLRCAGEVIFG